MELINIGQHCSKSECKQLDFLPLQCKCLKIFCSLHFQEHIQKCNSYENRIGILKKIDELHQCSHDSCKIKSVVPLICEKCNKHFCVTHRHIINCVDENPEILKSKKEQSQISIRQFKEAKENVDKMIDQNINKAMKRNKSAETARKIQLMRLKNKAVGQKTIPTMDRIYFDIYYVKEKTDCNMSVFVSKSWPLGKAIDAIAQECKLKNNNNTNVSLKLRLFEKNNGRIVSKNMSVKLQDMLNKNEIADGDSLIMSYVNDECVTIN